MADTNSLVVGGDGGGGPPSDLGNSTLVVVEKVNAPPLAPTEPKAAEPAPKLPAEPPVAEKTPPVAKSLAETPPKGDEPKTPAPANWPDNWRELMAGDDKKELARLQRMNSPLDVKNAWRGLEQRLSSGELKRGLPTNYTEAELKAYRESNGIPETPDKYDVEIGKGFVWGEADKPLLNDFTKFAHERNMPGEYVKSALEWFTNQQQVIADEIAQRDENERVTGGEALRAEWGNALQPNLAAMRNLFEGHSMPLPDGKAVPLFDVLMGARAEDGTKLGNNPAVLKFLSSVSRELNPLATLVPDSHGATAMKSAEARLNEINRMMADKTGPYWRGPQSAALQAEWRDLYEANEKAKTRAA